MRGEREERWAGGQMHISCWCEKALREENKEFLQTLPKEAAFRGKNGGPNIFMGAFIPQLYWRRRAWKIQLSGPFRSRIREESTDTEKLCRISGHIFRQQGNFRSAAAPGERRIYFWAFHIQWFMQQDDRDFYKSGFLRSAPWMAVRKERLIPSLTRMKTGFRYRNVGCPTILRLLYGKIEESDQFERVPGLEQNPHKGASLKKRAFVFFIKYASGICRAHKAKQCGPSKKTWEGAFEEWDRQ